MLLICGSTDFNKSLAIATSRSKREELVRPFLVAFPICRLEGLALRRLDDGRRYHLPRFDRSRFVTMSLFFSLAHQRRQSLQSSKPRRQVASSHAILHFKNVLFVRSNCSRAAEQREQIKASIALGAITRPHSPSEPVRQSRTCRRHREWGSRTNRPTRCAGCSCRAHRR